MRLFGFEVRLLPADPPQTPHVQPTDRVLSYTPEDRVLMAYGDARIVLAHLLRETRRRLLRNCEQPNYTLPFE